jgi:ribosomal protein S18 acetylase RimI-like enzyme
MTKQPAFKVRRMEEKDVLAVTSIEMGAFSDPWPESQIRYELKEQSLSQTLRCHCGR